MAVQLDDAMYRSLDQTVIHGDFHPGNVLYDRNRVTAVLDYDYSGPGAVLRDIGDGLMFFAACHARPFDPDNIWSLTQPWRVDEDRTLAFLAGYVAVRSIPAAWPWVSTLMLSRWFQCKLRGSRKVPVDRRIEFVLKDIWQPVELLKRHYQAWLALVVRRL